VFLRDSVIIFNVAGDTLRTPELWWDQSSQRIYTDKAVKIRKSGNLIYGVGMEARQDLSDVNIKQVTGTVYVADTTAQ
jgi:LPS export ABC transporter protein LptC